MASYCPDCHRGSWACACGLTFHEKLSTLHYDYENFDTRSKKNYYDSTTAEVMFGHDAADRYWELTEGQGALEPAADGEFYHTDHKGETKRATDEVIESFVGGEETADVV